MVRTGVDRRFMLLLLDVLWGAPVPPRHERHFELVGQSVLEWQDANREPVLTGSEARQTVLMRKGIDSDLARKLVKLVKSSKLKVQAAIQGDKLRISGKKRDDLQAAIALLKESDTELPLQYENFRD